MMSRIVRTRSVSLLSLTLRMLAPWLAVGVFWLGFGDAWLAILAYHAQILLWSLGRPLGLRRPMRDRITWLIALSALAGPALWLLLPHITRTDLGGWLALHGLSGASLVVMIAYFGLVHPLLEQAHWTPLREATPIAHVAFAGYHMLVLASLLTPPWLVVCSVILTAASVVWQEMTRRTGSAWVAVASHMAADAGIVLVAWLVR
jgi:membrane protease YdiL (CAAX protease family)